MSMLANMFCCIPSAFASGYLSLGEEERVSRVTRVVVHIEHMFLLWLHACGIALLIVSDSCEGSKEEKKGRSDGCICFTLW